MKKKIKMFIYVDHEKVDSIAAQLFEGLTESMYRERLSGVTAAEEQKDRIGSGRTYSDEQTQEDRVSERLRVHDFMYARLEDELVTRGNLFNISVTDLDKISPDVPFVKVKGRACISDVRMLASAMENHNKVMGALNSIGNGGVQLPKKKGDNSTPSGLSEHYLKSLRFLVLYGAKDQLSISVRVGGYIFTAPLRREMLRESEDLLVQKFSRNTEREIVAVGWITQSLSKEIPTSGGIADGAPFKKTILDFAGELDAVDHALYGRLENEVIFDPIALYIEL